MNSLVCTVLFVSQDPKANKSAKALVLHSTSSSLAPTVTTVVNPEIKAQAIVNIHLKVSME